MPELFGCCSSYIECSDAGQCLHKSNPDYERCYYRKNLEAGRIFYGKNAGKKPEVKKDYKIYLTCYDQPFAVLSRHDNWKSAVSYQLKPEKYEKVKTLFDNLEIPYAEDLIRCEFKNSCQKCEHCGVKDEITYCKLHNKKLDNLEICDKYEAKKQIRDCRVMFEVGEDKYHILNFDSWLIPEKTAEGIKKAFEAKGIPARVEQCGRYNTVEIPPWNQRVEMKVVSTELIFEPVIEPEPESKQKEVVFEQASIFDIIGA